MSFQKQERLPLPNPEDWITVAGVAKMLGRSQKMVINYLADQRLASYRIQGSRDRLAERLIWRADAERFRDAVKTFRKPGVVEQVRRRAAARQAEPEQRGAYLRPEEQAHA